MWRDLPPEEKSVYELKKQEDQVSFFGGSLYLFKFVCFNYLVFLFLCIYLFYYYLQSVLYYDGDCVGLALSCFKLDYVFHFLLLLNSIRSGIIESFSSMKLMPFYLWEGNAWRVFPTVIIKMRFLLKYKISLYVLFTTDFWYLYVGCISASNLRCFISIPGRILYILTEYCRLWPCLFCAAGSKRHV